MHLGDAVQERLAARLPPSRAERALEEIAHGQALWKKFKDINPQTFKTQGSFIREPVSCRTQVQ